MVKSTYLSQFSLVKTADSRSHPLIFLLVKQAISSLPLQVSAMDLDDELAPLETVQRAVRESNARNSCSPRLQTHSRSSSHDSYFESRSVSRHFT